MKNSATPRRAFTLIELLVVIAIISLLISILLPSLGQARQAARSISCGAMLHAMGQGSNFYAGSNKDYYPGRNSSGASYAGLGQVNGKLGYLTDLMLNDTTGDTPTTQWDWISPCIGESGGLNKNRAIRTQQIFNKFGCAAAVRTNDKIYSSSKPKDYDQFAAAFADTPFREGSYISPYSFHSLSSLTPNGTILNTMDRDSHGSPAVTPLSFRPRFDMVGNPSKKVFAADGTRYYTADDATLDFDIALDGWLGSFSDGGPIYDGSVPYGRSADGNNAGGVGWKFSLRHPLNSINGLRFDGHVTTMRGDDIYGRADYWYPAGSIYNGMNGTSEASARFKQGDALD